MIFVIESLEIELENWVRTLKSIKLVNLMKLKSNMTTNDTVGLLDHEESKNIYFMGFRLNPTQGYFHNFSSFIV